MKALIVAEPWISAIIQGEKTWEMRKNRCKFRGPIALIRKGSGHIVGLAEITDCKLPLCTPETYAEAERYHSIPASEQVDAFNEGWRIPWVLANARPLAEPVPYKHPQGAVIWVNLEPDTVARIEAQSP